MFGIGVSVVFLYGLSHVALVAILYPSGDDCASPHHQLHQRLHHLLVSLSVRRLRRSKALAPRLDYHRDYSDVLLPPDTEEDQHQERNLGVHKCFLHSKLYQHGLFAVTIASDKGTRAISTLIFTDSAHLARLSRGNFKGNRPDRSRIVTCSRFMKISCHNAERVNGEYRAVLPELCQLCSNKGSLRGASFIW